MSGTASELVRASVRGDLAEVKRLLDAGADVNGTDQHGMGPLLTFKPEVTEFLLSRGADPNRQLNESGTPVLIGVAYINQAECVRLLLQGGANPKAANLQTGETALHSCLSKPGDEAFERDRLELVKLLLEAGADPNHRTTPGVQTLAFWRDTRTRGETPLHRAAAYASEDTIRLLLNAGADKTIRDVNGDSPQSWASWHWRTRDLVLLLSP